jgi:dolichol-phosphate mannosyltransferase
MIYILLPCFNEYENLKILIKKIELISDYLKKKITIIIVNDGSTDQTKTNINLLKKKTKNKIIYIEHKKNLGINMAMYSGLKKFLLGGNKKSLLITMDSDNTHPVSIIPKMIKLIQLYNYDLVIASRFQKGSNIIGLSIFREYLSIGAKFLFKIFHPIEGVHDYTCNYRAYSYSILRNSNLIKKKFFEEKDFSIIADLLINLKKNIRKINIKEIPLKLRYDFKIGESKLNVSRNIYKTINLILRNLF